MSSDVVLSDLEPVGREESNSSASPSTTPSETCSASGIGPSRQPTLVNSRTSTEIQLLELLSSRSPNPWGHVLVNDASSSDSASASTSGENPRNPIQRLGKLVKSYLGSDLATGVLALFSFLGALLIGAWGVMLAKKQLDLGEWTFCKSYPNDTQVVSSTTCQRFAGKASLDGLTRREAPNGLESFNSSFQDRFPTLPPAYILEAVPRWIATPPTVDISSCSVVCWTAFQSYQVDTTRVFQANMDEISQYVQKLSTSIYIQILAISVLYAHWIYTQYRSSLNIECILELLLSTIKADFHHCMKSPFRTIWWMSCSSIILVCLSMDSAHDLRSSLKAYWISLRLFVLQSLTALSFSLLINVGRRLHIGSHDLAQLTGISNIQKRWRVLNELFDSRNCSQTILLIIFALIAQNLTASAYFALTLHIWNQEIHESFCGTQEEIRIEEIELIEIAIPGDSLGFNQAGRQEQGQCSPQTEAPIFVHEVTGGSPLDRSSSSVTVSQTFTNEAETVVENVVGAQTLENRSMLLEQDQSLPPVLTAYNVSTTALEITERTRKSGLLSRSRKVRGTAEDEAEFDPIFKVHSSRSFKPGQVFKVLWSEPSSHNGFGSSKSTLTDGKYEGKVYSSVRRFVVVASDSGHSQCLPIMTYNRAGTTKAGVKSEDHAIIYTSNKPPKELKGEILTKAPIKVNRKTPRVKLEVESRVNYAKIYTVEHNVRVLFIGSVSETSMPILAKDFDETWLKKQSVGSLAATKGELTGSLGKEE